MVPVLDLDPGKVMLGLFPLVFSTMVLGLFPTNYFPLKFFPPRFFLLSIFHLRFLLLNGSLTAGTEVCTTHTRFYTITTYKAKYDLSILQFYVL